VIVDGLVGFTGSMNVGNEYSGRFFKHLGSAAYRDIHLSLQGPAVADLSELFAEDWFFAVEETLQLSKTPHEAVGGETVSVLPSGPDQEHNASALLYFGGIAEARESVYLVTPYFIPDEATVRAFQVAALRGADVRLMVPEASDAALVTYAGRSYFTALLRSGVRIFAYQPAMLHSKIMVVDGTWALVGSANLDIRSFRLNFELGVLVSGGTLAGELERRFVADLEQCREITLAEFSRRGLAAQLKERVARLMSPVL
jgi:cardiolipin synthase